MFDWRERSFFCEIKEVVVYVLVSFVREEDAEFRGIEKGREVGAHSCDKEIILNMYAENLPAESIV
jgi:hypothetical protein